MTTVSLKAFRDAWVERERSILIVVTITVGVSALLTLLGAYGVLTRELNQRYLATNPASAILHVDAVDSKMLAAVRADPEIESAEARRAIGGRIKTGPMQWHSLELFVVPDFNQIAVSKFDPDGGEWPPKAGDVLIERDAFQLANAKIGDTVTVRIGDGQLHTVRVAGGVHDVGKAQARMENVVYGYISPATAAELAQPTSLNLLLIGVARQHYESNHIRQVAEALQRKLLDVGYRVDRIDFPTPGKHPHADLMTGLLLTVSSFGFFLVGMSGVLTLNFIAALMMKQVRQIGIMKALGATRWQLFGIYALHSMLLGTIATLGAIPMGIIGSHEIIKLLARLLNFDIGSFSIPLWAYATTVGSGIGVPFLASILPVWRTVAFPVRRALASTGTGSEMFGRDWLDRRLVNVRTGVRPVLLAVRNSFRRRLRFLLTCAALACAVTFFLAAINLKASMRYSYDRLFAAERYDLTLYLDKMYPATLIDQALQSVSPISTTEKWTSDEGSIATEVSQGVAPNSNAENAKSPHFTAIAIPADTRLFVPVIEKGRGLQSGDSDSVVLNPSMAAQNPGLTVGTRVRLRIGTLTQSWRVVGISRELASPPTVYIPISSLDPIHPHMTNIVQISLRDPNATSLDQIRDQIDPNLERKGIRLNGSRNTAEYHTAVDQHVLMIYIFLLVASIIVATVGGIGLMTTMGINVLERRRELGILRSIGATPLILAALVIGEAVTVAIAAWCIGSLLATPLVAGLALMIGRLLQVNFELRLASSSVLIALGASVIAGILASLLAAASAMRMSVREALSYE